MNYEVGQVVGDYQVVELLGAGGMGRVYKVRNLISQRLEAMKVLSADLEAEPELTERFLREIRVVGALDHPHIAGLHTAQRAGKHVHMLMEFVEGESLDKLMKRGRLPLPDVVRIVRQVLDALGFAHNEGVVHRDIKPPNIMLTPKGAAVLTDFGIAVGGHDRRMTQAGRAVGSLYYMSPEQINGDPNIDRRSDIYSLGVTLYELATGRRPFQGDTDFSLLSAHLHQTPPAPIELAPDIPPALSQIIMTALQKDPGARFQTTEAMSMALSHVFPGSDPAATVDIATVQQPVAPQAQTVMAEQRAKTVVQQPTPKPTPKPAPPPAQMKHGSGRRLIWLLAGSLATLAVLFLAATQLPFFNRTEAGSGQEVSRATPPPDPPPSTDPPPAATGTPPEAEAASSLKAGQPSDTGRNLARVEPPGTAGPPRVTPPVGRQATPPPVTPPVTRQLTQNQQPPPPTLPPGASQAQSPAPPAPPAVPPANAAAVRKMQERLIDTATRTGAVRRSIENLRRAQARSGLGLRRDFETAEQKLVYELDEAEAAIKAGDAEKAEKHLDSAELSLRFLENRLGG